jgi:hypothetical protein
MADRNRGLRSKFGVGYSQVAGGYVVDPLVGFASSPGSETSLCNLCVLCVSVVCFCSEFINHRDTENTEATQRRAPFRLLGQSFTFDLHKVSCACYHPLPRVVLTVAKLVSDEH